MPRIQRVMFALTTGVTAATVAAPLAAHPAGATPAKTAPVQAAECASQYPQWIGTYVGTLHEKKFTIVMQPGEQASYELTGVQKGTISARLEKAGVDAWWILFGGSKLDVGFWPYCSGGKVTKFQVKTEFGVRADTWVTRQQSQ
ncbi:hypothetical protein ACFOY4_09930 [Actinomadura syzygii]|uniref:Uncharacterized protein n=1 Tax=Actinomadura syzygii TaxID=1427538 RepID=A0A5D0UCR2_9ACTN|nr:hypothetical protein [Actinomadura syzygii]TYC15867.1 hypothetical protein FXF65_11025 [Actinomadura syzygii]